MMHLSRGMSNPRTSFFRRVNFIPEPGTCGGWFTLQDVFWPGGDGRERVPDRTGYRGCFLRGTG